MASIDDLKCDLAEIEKFSQIADRQQVKGILSIEAHKLKTQISHLLEEQKSKKGANETETTEKKPESNATRRYTKTITNYAWDQSSKFMKIYVTMDGVQNIPKENITCDFTDSSFKLRADDLSGSDHECRVAYLFKDIDTDKSYHKVKTDCVLVMLKKKEEVTWAYVTQQEAKSKDKKPPNAASAMGAAGAMGAMGAGGAPPGADDKGDPQEGLMKIMQQMYEDGDDEMKRTIAKSMYESRNKSTLAPDEMP